MKQGYIYSWVESLCNVTDSFSMAFLFLTRTLEIKYRFGVKFRFGVRSKQDRLIKLGNLLTRALETGAQDKNLSFASSFNKITDDPIMTTTALCTYCPYTLALLKLDIDMRLL